jgi:hypothetical protein
MLVRILSPLQHDGTRYDPSGEMQDVVGLNADQASKLASRRIIGADFCEKQIEPPPPPDKTEVAPDEAEPQQAPIEPEKTREESKPSHHKGKRG